MKHPHLWKYFYFEMVKDQSSIHEWNSIMEEAYKFSEFYNTTPRSDKACLPLRSMDKISTMTETTHLTDTLQKPYISGSFGREGKSESDAIRKYVEDFVVQITQQVESSNKKLAATPILSGSVSEGTKVGLPDEYDFILHLHELQETFDKSDVPLGYCPSQNVTDILTVFSQFFDGFLVQVNKKEQQMKNFFVLKSPMHNPAVKPFTITLFWNGYFFKDLLVNIDFVPAFTISYEKAKKGLPLLQKETANSQIFAVFKEDQFHCICLRPSFSMHERDLLKALPMCLKNAYRLAKAVRHTEVCPSVQLPDMTIASADEYITTYMLKTCLMHTVKGCEQHNVEDNEWLSPLSIKWAIKIFEQMKDFVEIFVGKIPNYFLTGEDICSSYDLSQTYGYAKQHYEKKQKITLTFIDCILQLLKELLQQCLQVRCLIQ